MAKRGRKPSENNKNYFNEKEEQYILEYLSIEDQEKREEIFSKHIYPVFCTMIESIIRRYKLFVPDEEYEDTFCDIMSFLMTKLDKFKPGEYKAYSYYGTICKNYLIGKIQTFNKIQERNPTYDSVQGGFNSLKYSDYEVENNGIAGEVIKRLIKKIKNMLENYEDFSLKECEIKLGKALINLFENWDYILTTNGSPKLNKSAILFFLKESTGLDAKGIRDNMKKFKIEFLLTKSDVID
jgi:hypothetical protein